MAKLPLAKAEQLVKRAIGAILERRDHAIAQTLLDLEVRVARLERRHDVAPTDGAAVTPSEGA